MNRRRIVLAVSLAVAAMGIAAMWSFSASATRSSSDAAEKLKYEANYQQARDKALTVTKERPRYTAPIATNTAGFLSGIHESSVSPFAPGRFALVNQWQNLVGKNHVWVWAGALATDERQGVVVLYPMIERNPGDFVWGDLQVFRSPIPSGAMRIVSAIGTRLKISTEDGYQFAFDVTNPALVQLGS